MRTPAVTFTLVAVALALSSAGCRGKRIDYTIPGLLEALKDEDPDVRATAATHLGKYGSEAKEAVGPLTEALDDPEKHVRVAAAYSLGGIGPDARDAVPALRGKLKDGDPRLREAAADALKQILDPKPKSKGGAAKPERKPERPGAGAGVSRPLGQED